MDSCTDLIPWLAEGIHPFKQVTQLRLDSRLSILTQCPHLYPLYQYAMLRLHAGSLGRTMTVTKGFI
jgi:hypothetical protein